MRAMQEKMDLLTDVHLSMEQIENGEGVDSEAAKEDLLKRIGK